MRHAARPSRTLLALVAVMLAASGCTGSGGDNDDESADSGSGSGPAETADAPVEHQLRDADTDRLLADGAGGLAFESTATNLVEGPAARPPSDNTGRKLIAKGDVSLESDDVEAAVTDVEAVVRHYFGEVTERQTTTNKDGDVSSAVLLLRIPVADFDKAFTDLEGVANLKSSNTGKEDVTTKVIDTKVRIRAQRLSLARVEALFDRAQSISDIIRIESQVSRRQADLESLERRLHYLNNQTSMSTITVGITLPPKEKKEEKQEKKEPEEAGFLAGLSDGWHALQSFGTDVATVSGQLLPFAGVLLLVGGPLWLLARRLRRRDASAPADATPADA